MNYTEMLFNRDERLVNLLNQADSKNLELIEEINNREDEIERLNNIIDELEKTLKELIKEQEYGYKKYPENWEKRKSVCNTWLRSRDCYLCIYNYLQELKGSDKE